MSAAAASQAMAGLSALVGERLQAGGEVRFTVTTTSMAPLLRPGDWLVAQSVVAADLRPGDVVLYCRSGQLVAHRVVRCERRNGICRLRLKGDRNWFYDDLPGGFAVGDLLGVAVRVERGSWALTLQSRWLRVANAGIAGLSDGHGALRRWRGNPLRRAAQTTMAALLWLGGQATWALAARETGECY